MGGLYYPYPKDELLCPFGYLFKEFRNHWGLPPDGDNESACPTMQEAGIWDENCEVIEHDDKRIPKAKVFVNGKDSGTDPDEL